MLNHRIQIQNNFSEMFPIMPCTKIAQIVLLHGRTKCLPELLSESFQWTSWYIYSDTKSLRILLESASQSHPVIGFLVAHVVNRESPAQFEHRIKPRMYVRRVTRSTMYEKAPFC